VVAGRHRRNRIIDRIHAAVDDPRGARRRLTGALTGPSPDSLPIRSLSVRGSSRSERGPRVRDVGVFSSVCRIASGAPGRFVCIAGPGRPTCSGSCPLVSVSTLPAEGRREREKERSLPPSRPSVAPDGFHRSQTGCSPPAVCRDNCPSRRRYTRASATLAHPRLSRFSRNPRTTPTDARIRDGHPCRATDWVGTIQLALRHRSALSTHDPAWTLLRSRGSSVRVTEADHRPSATVHTSETALVLGQTPWLSRLATSSLLGIDLSKSRRIPAPLGAG
jgi:hypothetical protein